MPTVIPPEIARVVEGPDLSGGMIGGVVGGAPGGAVGGVIESMLARNITIEAPALLPLPLPPPPPPPIPKAPVDSKKAYRVGGAVKEPRLISLVPPKYPPLAIRSRVAGTVILEATLTETGTVDGIKVVSGHPLLLQAAIDAVRQWRYEPTLLNGEPAAVILTAVVRFELPTLSE
jgi:protein TonB